MRFPTRGHKYESAEQFSHAIATNLTTALGARRFANQRYRGLGIHFTAYEWVDGFWIPELFLISNWTNPSYTAVRTEGFQVTRETYATLKKLSERSKDHGERAARIEVHKALHTTPLILRFNNGHPHLYNRVANAILNSVHALSYYGPLRDGATAATHLSIARRPVEFISKLVADFLEPGRRPVGGKPHDLAVSPGGTYESTTGD